MGTWCIYAVKHKKIKKLGNEGILKKKKNKKRFFSCIVYVLYAIGSHSESL